jgi:D-xylose transport system permease protein
MLAVIWAIFGAANSSFLTATNLTNLLLQVIPVGLISVGVVLVILLGEIDLSVGAVSGFCGAVIIVLNVTHGVPAWLAIVVGVAAGALIGVVQGAVAAFFRIPSFVVTLAGLLFWQGAQLYVLGDQGTINVNGGLIPSLMSTYFDRAVAWPLLAGAVFLHVLVAQRRRRARQRALLTTSPWLHLIARELAVAIGAAAATLILVHDRGVPLALVIFVVIVIFGDIAARATRAGRQLYAVGGNAEAARRAGINVTRVRIIVFAIASAMAAVGGLFAASRLYAVNQSSGSGDVLLNAIAGPVIAGTSLFGGRGSLWSALLGALVIGSISNGMDLLSLQSSVKFMVTGAVLLIAVVIDAAARRVRTEGS